MTVMTRKTRTPLRSPVKWVGGKSRTAATIAALAPEGYRRLVEPFCGSAAVFFASRPSTALLTDAVTDLIACLRAVRDAPRELMAVLDEMPNTRERYYEIRGQDPDELDDFQRAARMLYLNKTSFRGLWRVNQQGGMNTPYGDYDRPYYNRETLLDASEALATANLDVADFREVLPQCSDTDWVYLDPPYVPDREWGEYDRYTPDKFTDDAHAALADQVRDLDARGVPWLLTNSNTDAVRDLYDDWHITVLPTRRDVALKSKERSSVDLVVSNYEYELPEAMFSLAAWDAA